MEEFYQICFKQGVFIEEFEFGLVVFEVCLVRVMIRAKKISVKKRMVLEWPRDSREIKEVES